MGDNLSRKTSEKQVLNSCLALVVKVEIQEDCSCIGCNYLARECTFQGDVDLLEMHLDLRECRQHFVVSSQSPGRTPLTTSLKSYVVGVVASPIFAECPQKIM